ncbi:MAG: PaaI family thioesterase [Acidimicrobiia bacterium]
MSGFHDPDAGRSVARYLGLTLEEVGEVRAGGAEVHGTAPAPGYLRLPDGSIAMGALLGLADSVAGLCGGLAALPGWVVSTNLMLRAVDLDVVGPLDLAAEVLRVGRNAVVTTVTVRDGHDATLVAEGTLTSAILQPAGGPPVYERPLVLRAPPLDPDTTPALDQFVGVRSVDDDTVAIDLTDDLRNPWGILHGGITAALVDVAARHATGASRTTDAVVHFVRPGRVGPVVASVRRVGARADGHLVRVELRDRGSDDRVMAVAVATARG